MSAEQMQQAVSRLEAVAARLESLAVTGVKSGGSVTSEPQAGPMSTAPFVLAFDGILNGEFAKFIELSSKIGGDVETQANMVKAAFQDLREFLALASRSKKPAQNVLQDLLNPLSQHISAIQEFREKNRTSPNFNHLSGISEAIPALGWVAVEPTPGPYVKDMQDAGMFYTNRVLKDYKEKDQTHVDWTKAWNGTLRDMVTYIKDHHTTGVSWNPQGGDAAASKPSAGKGAPPPPPPGPPPPPPPAQEPSESGGGGSDVHAALFAEINRGTAISSGLKKVTDDMKTHKNPALRAGSTVTAVTSSSGVRAGPAPFKATAPKIAPKPGSKPAEVTKPPVLELQDKKWIVEYQVGNKTMVIQDTNIKQAVYMFKCQDSTLQVKGKVNSIIVDSCKKVAIAFDDVVASIEFVNCQSVQAQVMGKCPTVSIDKTDGCMMYLSKDSLDAEIVTAKSSEMNILVPKDDGDFAEFPLPEQFKTKWNGKKFTTDCAEGV